ncbi:hypothetical protein AAZV13_03G065500 [Glycine max]
MTNHQKSASNNLIRGANILVDPNGEIKLTDFGMAKHEHKIKRVKVQKRILGKRLNRSTQNELLQVQKWSSMKFLNTLEEVPLLQLYLSDTGTKTKGMSLRRYVLPARLT